MRQLNRTVRTEVQEHDGVAAFHYRYRLIIAVHDNTRLNEFIIYGILVRRSDRLQCIGIFRAFAIYHRTVSFLYTFPAFITVHRKVASGYRSNFTYANFLDLLE
ncbi:hypothetical protein D3C75_1054990 [compost metagenome]